jgi:hypothetical protein
MKNIGEYDILVQRTKNNKPLTRRGGLIHLKMLLA